MVFIFFLAPTDSWADDEKYECDVGWQAFQAGCYKLTSEKIDWDSAQKTCQRMEANLLSIHTLPELEFTIRNLMKGHLSIFLIITLLAFLLNWIANVSQKCNEIISVKIHFVVYNTKPTGSGN